MGPWQQADRQTAGSAAPRPRTRSTRCAGSRVAAHVRGAPQELFLVNGHRSLFAVVGVVVPAKRDVSVREIGEVMVGDRDTVSLASQTVQNVFRTAEGPLRIDDVCGRCRPSLVDISA